jgi:hydroxyacylglutathione hydrolase
MTLEVHQLPCLSDNYGDLLPTRPARAARRPASIPPDAEAYLREAAAKGWTHHPQIWNTHWQP